MEVKKLTVKLRLITEMLGTVPKNPGVYKEYIESKKPKELENEDESVNVVAMEEKGWTGYLCNEKGYFVYDYFVKGFIKNAAKVLREELGIKALKQKVSDYVFVYPRRIYIGELRELKSYERPLRAETPQGPRVTLVRSDIIEQETEIEFQIKLLKHKEITPQVIEELFRYGEFQGFGQFRNGGFGRFELISIKPAE